MPLPLVTAGLSILPSIISAFKKPTGEKVLNVAKEAFSSVTGADLVNVGAYELESKLNSMPVESAVKFIKLIVKREDIKKELELAWVENTKDARSMYRFTGHAQTDIESQMIMNLNVLYIILLVIIECLCVYYLKDKGEILAIATGVISAVITSLLNERQTVVNFRFGSSQGD